MKYAPKGEATYHPNFPEPKSTLCRYPKIHRFGNLYVVRATCGDWQDVVVDWFATENEALFFIQDTFTCGSEHWQRQPCAVLDLLIRGNRCRPEKKTRSKAA